MSFKYDLKVDQPYYSAEGDVELRIVELVVEHPNRMLASFTRIGESGVNGALSCTSWHEHINRQLFEKALDAGDYGLPF